MKIEKRTEPLRIVREGGNVPGVLFGKTIDPVSIQIDEKQLHELVNEFGFTKTFKVKLGKETHQVYIKEVQRDILNKNHVLNVKILKVVAGDTIKAHVPLNIIGREVIEKPGVIVQVIADYIEVEYPIGKGLSSIDVDISSLKSGENIHIRDLSLPEYLEIHDDSDKILITVSEVVYREEEESEEVEVVDPMDVEVLKQKEE